MIRFAARLLAADNAGDGAPRSAASAPAAYQDIAVSCMLWGLPAKEADELAGVLLTRGIGPDTARRLFIGSGIVQ